MIRKTGEGTPALCVNFNPPMLLHEAFERFSGMFLMDFRTGTDICFIKLTHKANAHPK
jgi:hypothetical protein